MPAPPPPPLPAPAPAPASAPDAPLARSDPARSDPGPDPDPGPGPARRLRVLSAEDNRTNRLVLQRMLADQPVELAFAVDGHEAVAQFSAFRPDLIFMDISMPGMDGRAATRAIRALPKGAGVPIIALTAHALAGDEDGFRAAGMTGYLTKPLRKAALVEVLRAHGAAV